MATEHAEGFVEDGFTGRGGLRIFLRRWTPSEPRGVLVICHGVNAHGGLIVHGTADKVTVCKGSEFFFQTAGSTDKTLKLYEGHAHDLLADVGKEDVIADMLAWIEARLPASGDGAKQSFE